MSVFCFHASDASKTPTFNNTETRYQTGLKNLWDITLAYVKTKRDAPTPPAQFPVQPITQEQLASTAAQPTLYRLGHSSVLLQLDGKLLLLDPVFGERASPVSWAGPKRFHPVPITAEDLPEIDAVIISHDHYDHLDKATIAALQHKTKRFIVPLRVGEHLTRWGVDKSHITELDWWQSTQLDSLEITAAPTQHFSGRGLFDRDKTLWASWALRGQQARVYFSGDSGYFTGFKEIGERLGPFDLTLIETGAYNPLWHAIHMLPEESVQAHVDLQGKIMISVHNSTFDLALHDWHEPYVRAEKAAALQGVSLITPMIGAPVTITSPYGDTAWWQQLMTEQRVTPQAPYPASS